MGKKSEVTFPAIVDPKPTVEAIYCVDPRFQLAFEGFLTQTLGLRRGMDVVEPTVAGGPAPLAHPMEMKSRCRYLIRQTIFMCSHFPINTVVLIGHEDCGYYGIIPQNGSVSKCREKDDLPIAASMLGLVIPERVSIEAYYAYFVDKKRTRIAFEKIV